jgi:hypothetical protein
LTVTEEPFRCGKSTANDAHDGDDDELQGFSKGVAALFLKMIDAVMGWKYRSTSASKSDAGVKVGVLTSSRTSRPARIEITVPLGLETFTIVVVVSSDTSLDVCAPSSSRRPSYSRRITTTRSSILKLERQVKDEARESPVRFLEYTFTRSVAEALRSHSRGSEKVIDVYSPPILRLVRQPVSCTSTSSVPPCPRG